MTELELNKMLRSQFEKGGWTARKLARELNMTYSGVWQLLKKDECTVSRLAALSEAFQYNFFRELAEKFPYTAPDYTSAADNAEKESLRVRVRELELELKVLKEAIRLMRG
jgi:transcriptional regulator with XRE-family HTH domain